MGGTAGELTVRTRGGERCEARVRGHVMRFDQPPNMIDHNTGPTPVEVFVAAIAADVAQHAHRYLDCRGLPARVSVTARFQTAVQPAHLGRVELEVAVTGLPAGLRASLINVLEHSCTYESLRFQPEMSIGLRSPDDDHDAAAPPTPPSLSAEISGCRPSSASQAPQQR